MYSPHSETTLPVAESDGASKKRIAPSLTFSRNPNPPSDIRETLSPSTPAEFRASWIVQSVPYCFVYVVWLSLEIGDLEVALSKLSPA